MNNPLLVAGAFIGTYDQLDSLPVGAVICETGNERRAWEKNDDNMWRGIDLLDGVGPYEPSAFSLGRYNKVLSVPAGPHIEPPRETLMQFMWKFRENAISGAHENGVSIEACMKGLRLLGLENDDFPLGPKVKFKVLDDRAEFPENTVVANALHTDPKHARFTLFVRKRRTWHTLLGREGLGRDAVIMDYPGVVIPPAWWTEVGTDKSEEEIRQFKARAWRISLQIKSEQSWCNTLDHVINRVGVNARSLREAAGYGVGDRVGQRDAARCPEGTLFFYQSTEWTDHWAVYVRDDTQDNLCRTRRLAGSRHDNAPALGNYQASMVTLAVPVGGNWVVDQGSVPQMLDLLPIGTVFTYSDVRYVVAQDRGIAPFPRDASIPRSGPHRPYVFNTSPITINRFPEEQS